MKHATSEQFEDFDELQRLERVTSLCPVQHAMDEDESALREGWNALTRMLQAVEEPIDAASLSARSAPIARQSSRRRAMWCVATVLAAAASLMLVWKLLPNGNSDGGAAQHAGQSTAPQQLVTQSPSASTNQGTVLSWQDPLDEQLSDLRTQLRDVYWSGDGLRRSDYLLDNMSTIDLELRDNTL